MNAKVISVVLLIALAASLGLLGKLGWNNYQLRNAKDQLDSELTQAKLQAGRAHTQLGNANARISSLSANLQAEVAALKASVTRYAELEADYKVLRQKKDKVIVEYYPTPDVEIACPETDVIRGLLYEAVTEKTLAPVKELKAAMEDERVTITCLVRPVPNLHRNIPYQITYAIHLQFKGKLIETRTPTGLINHYAELYEIDKDGKEVTKLDLTKFEVVVNDETSPHFIVWAPHLDVGILGGWNTSSGFRTGGSLGFSVMGYGRTINDLVWRFPRLSMDLSGKAGIGLTPVAYNLGDPLPIVSNIWVGPHITWMFSREATLGIFMGGVL